MLPFTLKVLYLIRQQSWSYEWHCFRIRPPISIVTKSLRHRFRFLRQLYLLSSSSLSTESKSSATQQFRIVLAPWRNRLAS